MERSACDDPAARRLLLAVASPLVVAVAACSATTTGSGRDAGASEASPPDAAPCSDPSLTEPATDPDYRVVVSSNDNSNIPFPSAGAGWELRYAFKVPPLPCSPTWNPTNQAFYVWGDLDFDAYGSSGQYPLSPYLFDQIVPQIMVGDVLSSSSTSYAPSWSHLTTWAMQAQYFWKNGVTGTAYAQTGELVPVDIGDVLTTVIGYDATSGAITASISTSTATSSIVLARPFPDRSPPLFSSWTDFFSQAESKSSTLLGRPVLDLESHYVDPATLCPILPFAVEGISIPGASTGALFQTSTAGGLSCPGALATLSF